MQASGALFFDRIFLRFFRCVVDVLEVLRRLSRLVHADERDIEGDVPDAHQDEGQTDRDGDEERAGGIRGQRHDAEDDGDQSDDQDAREDCLVLHEIPGHKGDGGSGQTHEDQEHSIQHD